MSEVSVMGLDLAKHVFQVHGAAGVAMTATVHDASAARGLLPAAHMINSGYVDAGLLVASRVDHALDLLGPALPDSSRQAQAGQGYELGAFTILWSERAARCPDGQVSQSWKEDRDERGAAVVRIGFSQKSCGPRRSRALCSPSRPSGEPPTAEDPVAAYL